MCVAHTAVPHILLWPAQGLSQGYALCRVLSEQGAWQGRLGDLLPRLGRHVVLCAGYIAAHLGSPELATAGGQDAGPAVLAKRPEPAVLQELLPQAP